MIAAALKTILVVDDEPKIRGILAEVLSEPGRVVLSAANGYEALRLLAEHHIDLLVTDVRMPGISGFELARQSKVMRPNLTVIYLSGCIVDTEWEAGRKLGLLFHKPVRTDELLREISHALGFDAPYRDC
jgi:CheY-like chemotaxis protein